FPAVYPRAGKGGRGTEETSGDDGSVAFALHSVTNCAGIFVEVLAVFQARFVDCNRIGQSCRFVGSGCDGTAHTSGHRHSVSRWLTHALGLISPKNRLGLLVTKCRRIVHTLQGI